MLAIGALVAIGDLRTHWPWTAGAILVALVAMALGTRLVSASTLILVVAASQRLLAVALEPSLSDDVWRYLWEGHVALAGENPWHHAPEDVHLEPLRASSVWPLVAHRDVPSLYPPLSVTAFSIAASTPAPLIAWKLLLVLVDLGVCWLVIVSLRRRGLPAGRAVWYAWNPLPIIEGPGMGHLDSIGLALVLGGLLALDSRQDRTDSVDRPERTIRAGVLLALGALAKLAPLVALPIWARASRAPIRLIVVALTVAALGAVPMVVAGPPPALTTYAVSWEFNGPFYEPLWRLLDQLDADERVKSGLDQIEAITGRYELLDPLYPRVYPQLLAKLLLVAAAAVAALRLLRGADRDPLVGTGRLFGILLLCSATLYPWYLLWVQPFAAISERRAWLVAAATSWLCYAAQFGLVDLWPWIWALQWVPLVLVRLGEKPWSSTS